LIGETDHIDDLARLTQLDLVMGRRPSKAKRGHRGPSKRLLNTSGQLARRASQLALSTGQVPGHER
jgi:hypothetical protein